MRRTIGPRRLTRHRPRVEVLEVRSLLSLVPAGALDQTFGTQGSTEIPLVPPSDAATAIPSGAGAGAVAADGTIVLAGSYALDGVAYYTIEHLNANGTPDTSFGQGGLATIPVGTAPTTSSSTVPIASAVVVRPDGTIDVAGSLSSPTTTSSELSGVIQVTPTGTLDTTFGNQGMAVLPNLDADNGPFEGINAIALTASGQLVVEGEDFVSMGSATDPALFAARFNVNGSLDTTFGTGGVATVPVTVNGNTSATAVSVGVLPGGQVILAGQVVDGTTGTGSTAVNSYESVLVGLNSDGTLDTTFGGTSAAGMVFLTGINDLAVESSGQFIVLGGNSLYRYNADGTLDTTFGTNGMSVEIPVELMTQGVTVLADGQFLVAGAVATTNNPDVPQNYGVVRLNADGTLDTTFGNTAIPSLSAFLTGNYSGGASLASLSSTGKIILTGYSLIRNSSTSSTYYLTAVGVNSTATATPVLDQAPADYDGSGKTNLAVYIPSAGEFAYRPTNGSADVIVPFGITGAGETIPAPGDYTGAGQTEIAAYLPSLGLYAYRPADGGPDVLEAFGIAGSGQSIPVPGDYFGTGVDDIAVYMPAIAAYGIRNPAGGPDEIIPYGIPGNGQSLPAPGDYFGTGQTDLAVYLPSIGSFAIRNPTTGTDEIIPFGISGTGNSIPIPGDYDGSGVTELAVYLPRLGEFAYRPADGAPDVLIRFGTAGDGSIPVPGDYDGSGVTEIAIYNPSYASFAYRPADGGADVIEQFGVAGTGASLPAAAPASSNIPAINSITILGLVLTSASVSSESVDTSLVRIASKLPAQADASKPTT